MKAIEATLSTIDTALRDVSIEISQALHDDPGMRLHKANAVIGEFRHRLRELFRTAAGPMPRGWAEA